MAEQTSSNKHIDADILQCKADILRIQQLRAAAAREKQPTPKVDVRQEAKSADAGISGPGEDSGTEKPQRVQEARPGEQPQPESQLEEVKPAPAEEAIQQPPVIEKHAGGAVAAELQQPETTADMVSISESEEKSAEAVHTPTEVEQAKRVEETAAAARAELEKWLARITAAVETEQAKIVEEISTQAKAAQARHLQEITEAAKLEQAKWLEEISLAIQAEQAEHLEKITAATESELSRRLAAAAAAIENEKTRCLDDIRAAANTEKAKCLEEISATIKMLKATLEVKAKASTASSAEPAASLEKKTASAGEELSAGAGGQTAPPDEVRIIEDIASMGRGQDEDRAGIPKFDLAEQIMAEQRKISAVRRKGPGKKTRAETGGVEDVLAGPPQRAAGRDKLPVSLQQETFLEPEVIAKIVVEDIERLCNQPACPTKHSSNSGD